MVPTAPFPFTILFLPILCAYSTSLHPFACFPKDNSCVLNHPVSNGFCKNSLYIYSPKYKQSKR